jgi:hypothetical protein
MLSSRIRSMPRKCAGNIRRSLYSHSPPPPSPHLPLPRTRHHDLTAENWRGLHHDGGEKGGMLLSTRHYRQRIGAMSNTAQSAKHEGSRGHAPGRVGWAQQYQYPNSPFQACPRHKEHSPRPPPCSERCPSLRWKMGTQLWRSFRARCSFRAADDQVAQRMQEGSCLIYCMVTCVTVC